MNNEEQIKTITERIKSQKEIIEELGKYDRVAEDYLSLLCELQAELSHCTKEVDYYVIANTDYRAFGDDHSEVYGIVEMICCANCCHAWQRWLSSENRGFMRQRELSYGVGRIGMSSTKIKEVGQKIVKYKGRTLAESMDSDEMRVNSGWLD
jgi:hypothetical protein